MADSQRHIASSQSGQPKEGADGGKCRRSTNQGRGWVAALKSPSDALDRPDRGQAAAPWSAAAAAATAARPAPQLGVGAPAQARYLVPIGGVVEVVVACVVVATAYASALTGVLGGLFLLSPTAYVGLVPIVALGVMTARALPTANEPAIRDRYVDYAIGLPLLACALVLLLLFPAHASPLFWQRRLDLLSVPLFTAGAVATIFGIRALWRVRAGIALLFLGMLVPLTSSLDGLLSPIRGATSYGVIIGSKAALGFVIVGLALMSLANGRLVRKALWFVAGVGLSWGLAAAGGWVLLADRPGAGDDATVHRVVELAMLLLSVFVMVGVFPLLGLRFFRKGQKASLANFVQRSLHPAGPRRGTPFAALTVVAVAAVFGFIGESSLPNYSAVLTETGSPRLDARLLGQVAIPGRSPEPLGSLPWVERYYGPTATGERYGLDCTCAIPVGSLASSPRVIVDDIVTSQDLPLAAPQLDLILAVRGSLLVNLIRVDLGNGVVGHAAVYRQPSGPDWIAIYWDWPVIAASGTRYEHLVVEAFGSPTGPLTAGERGPGALQHVAMSISDWLDGAPSQPIGDSSARLRSYLDVIARTIVARISAVAPSAGTSR
jgi:hypothetical protein